ncbi:MAG TPA: class I SAM-dependent methyltransferase [Candidatus Limnocylindria bacterium]|jgi:SAM-dependent methyltransferase
MSLGSVFRDADVARAYRQRAPYPEETFAILAELIVEPRTVLDAGTGTGALARPMLQFAERVDAVDPSAAMIDAGRRLPGGDDHRLRWIAGTAEDAPLDPPYGLITAGSSVHWMDTERVMGRFETALARGAQLALVETDDGEHPLPEMLEIIRRYSELDHHADLGDTVATLEASGRFERRGERRTAPVPLRRSVEDYLDFLHSTSTLARVRLGPRATQFDAEVRALFLRNGLSFIERQVVGVVIWGRPVGR